MSVAPCGSVYVDLAPVFAVDVGGLDVLCSDDESGVGVHFASLMVQIGLAGVVTILLTSLAGMRSCRPTRNA